jgi:hypothetical protein
MNCVALEIILTGRKVPAEECLNDGAPIAANRAWKERPGLLGAALENAFRNSGKTREQGEPRNVMVLPGEASASRIGIEEDGW